ncbi:hypothetical protein GCM10008915_23450 [Bifidobacterium pullorum subsp. gallinarum]
MITYEFGATTFSYFDAEVASIWATFDIEYYSSKGEFLNADKIVEKAHWVTSSSVPVGSGTLKLDL